MGEGGSEAGGVSSRTGPSSPQREVKTGAVGPVLDAPGRSWTLLLSTLMRYCSRSGSLKADPVICALQGAAESTT